MALMWSPTFSFKSPGIAIFIYGRRRQLREDISLWGMRCQYISWGIKVKVKAFPCSIPSVGPEADPGLQEVSLQVTVSHSLGGRLPLLSARPAVTFPAAQHHRPLAGTKLYCLVTEAHKCEQLA